MTITRRAILGATAIVPLAVAGCAGTASGITPQIVVTDAQTVVAGLSGMFKSLTAQYPTLIPTTAAAKITADLSVAAAAAASLVTGMPGATAAAVVQNIEGWVNDVLNVLAAPPINGLIPAPFNQVIGAVAFVAPTLEAFVASFIPTAPKAAASRMVGLMIGASQPVDSQAQALSILRAAAK